MKRCFDLCNSFSLCLFKMTQPPFASYLLALAIRTTSWKNNTDDQRFALLYIYAQYCIYIPNNLFTSALSYTIYYICNIYSKQSTTSTTSYTTSILLSQYMLLKFVAYFFVSQNSAIYFSIQSKIQFHASPSVLVQACEDYIRFQRSFQQIHDL